MVKKLNWHEMLSTAFVELGANPVQSEIIWMASDYSAANDNAQTFSILLVDGAKAQCWVEARKNFRQRTRDEIKFSRIGQIPDSKHSQFIEIVEKLSGYLVTIHAPLEAVFNLLGRDEINWFRKQGQLEACWSPELLGRVGVVARLASVLVHKLALPNAQIRWVSDSDPVLDTSKRKADFARIFKVDCPEDRRQQFEGLDFWKTAEDSDDKSLRDLASVPDLACGVVHEYCMTKGGEVNNIARRDLLVSWLSKYDTGLKKLSFRYSSCGANEVKLEAWNFLI